MIKTGDHARDQARLQLEHILQLLGAFVGAGHDSKASEDARDAIQDSPLSVEVRDGWRIPGTMEGTHEPEEFKILLCTGGPAVRIIGTLNCSEPDSCTLQYQDWGTPWTDYQLTSEQEEKLLAYCSHFYFGEG